MAEPGEAGPNGQLWVKMYPSVSANSTFKWTNPQTGAVYDVRTPKKFPAQGLFLWMPPPPGGVHTLGTQPIQLQAPPGYNAGEVFCGPETQGLDVKVPMPWPSGGKFMWTPPPFENAMPVAQPMAIVMAQPSMHQITVPAGVAPGQMMKATIADGRSIDVAVPAGAQPGTTIQIQVPPAPVAVQAVVATPVQQTEDFKTVEQMFAKVPSPVQAVAAPVQVASTAVKAEPSS